MVLEAIRYQPGSLQILNQLKLPHQEEYDEVRGSTDGWHAIRDMRTRGAPAIAIVAALALAVELQNNKTSDIAEEVKVFVIEKLKYLVTSRPTAVNLADAAGKLEKIVTSAAAKEGSDGAAVSKAYCDAAAQMLVDDVSDNEAIGKHGAEWIVSKAGGGQVSVVTHCNTGYVVNSHRRMRFGLHTESVQLSRHCRLRYSSRCDSLPSRERISEARLLHRDQALQPGLSLDRLRAGA
jgi:methylthioribose-1-phosphate isomerase